MCGFICIVILDGYYFSPTGGADKSVVVFDAMSQQILATLKGHTKKVTNVVFHPSQVLCLEL